MRSWRRRPPKHQLAELRQQVRALVKQGEIPLQKALVQALVHEIKVESPEAIIPVFKWPSSEEEIDSVRAPAGLVGPQGLEPCPPD
jgi:hypothetical protein